MTANSDGPSFTLSPPGFLRGIALSAQTVWMEMLRREEYVALLILMGLYLLFALAARLVGATGPESSSLLLNLGLSVSAGLAALMTILSAVRLLPVEIENRTIYPLLAKPVSRSCVLTGKVVATVVAGWFVLVVFVSLTLLFTRRLPAMHPLMFAQAFGLLLVALLLLASLSVLLSLLVPKPINIVVMIYLYLAGGVTSSIIGSLAARKGVPQTLITWSVGLIPDFSKLSLMQRFTDGGGPLMWSDWGQLAVYGLLPSLACLLLANWFFERRAL